MVRESGGQLLEVLLQLLLPLAGQLTGVRHQISPVSRLAAVLLQQVLLVIPHLHTHYEEGEGRQFFYTSTHGLLLLVVLGVEV